tara:strand:+ start:9949 stop:11451 length:1503 start_codon:yes stop_codon:yes gene_type:complete
MYPITFTLTNIVKIISFMSPFLLSLTIILFSILSNKILQGLVLLIGIVIVTFINYLLKNIIKSKQSVNASPFCNILPFPFTYKENESVFDSPSLSTTVLAFICSYLIFPMITHSNINFPVIIFSLIFICSNGVVEYMDKCSQAGGIVLGFIVGIILGVLYYNLIVSSGYKEIAYFNEVISDNTQCSKPGPTKFRCRKYVRGDRDKEGNYVSREIQFETESTATSSIINPPTTFSMNRIHTLNTDLSGGYYYYLTMPTKGETGKANANHISNLLKCGNVIEEASYEAFWHLTGHNTFDDQKEHFQYIVDCSATDTITDVIRDLISGNTGKTIWQDHSNNTEIPSYMGNPYLDVLNLTTTTGTNTNYYLIPGAADMSVCDVLANKIGCAPCVDISSTNAMGSVSNTYKIELGLLYENMDSNPNNTFANKTSADITSVKDAGWGLTYCAKNPEEYNADPDFIVKTYNVNIIPQPGGYGDVTEAKDNRYAYWLDPDKNGINFKI